uniref:Uncharacterized protein n=2 Tax=Chenopodium quinoa TaxID=63459 RepID=A0A803M9E7_CHEQI
MSHIFSIIFLTLFLSLRYTTAVQNHNLHSNQQKQIYIISIQNNLKPNAFSNVEDWYKSILSRINSNPSDSLLHVYNTVFHGFSARLRPEHADSLRAQVEVISIIPDIVYQPQITRSPHFLGLDTYHTPSGLLKDSNLGSNVVVGVIDTGIKPEHPSFNDQGMDPVPLHFKGVCEGGVDFPSSLCNKKLVGVRCFASAMPKGEPITARDDFGHGTHTASTIAGRTSPKNVSFFGYAEGEATGIAPKARLAVYKTCWAFGCSGSDVLAAMDKAVEDGVDVISLSLGPVASRDYTTDPIAIGAFGAFQKGVFVSVAAGNGGPLPGQISASAPWYISVGASTIDRTFPADVILDNGEVLSGSSLYTGEPLPKNKTFPLVHFAKDYALEQCLPGSLDAIDVKGKIVICSPGLINKVEKGVVVGKAGGVGVIVALNDPTLGENDTQKSDPYTIPGLTIPIGATTKLLDEISKQKVKEGTIVFRGTQIGEKPAPVVASFSSRGPNNVSKYVLKPDMIAPGVDILAAWPEDVSPSRLEEDHRVTKYNIASGTSMACPHVSGLAALLKSAHPDWKPAMIKSALMTTAYIGYHEMSRMTQNQDQVSYWATGAGHVNPEKANDPGLVYDISEDDFIQNLCASGYNATEMKIIVKKSVICDEKSKVNEWDLNYPALVVPSDFEGKVFNRTLTSVGSTASTYTAKVSSPAGFNVTVNPLELSFKKKWDKQSFSVTISALKDQGIMLNEQATSSVSWTDGKRSVTIPLIMV